MKLGKITGTKISQLYFKKKYQIYYFIAFNASLPFYLYRQKKVMLFNINLYNSTTR